MNALAKDVAPWPVYEFRPVPRLYVHEWSPTSFDRKWLRYADGKWIEDDGEWDVAFITADTSGAPFALYFDVPYQRNIIWSWLPGHWRADGPARHPRQNPWHYMLRPGTKDWGGDWGRNRHENTRVGNEAMTKLSGERGCANGRAPEFHIGDPYIAAGLLRVRDTQELVVFPERFHCMYCGEIALPASAGEKP